MQGMLIAAIIRVAVDDRRLYVRVVGFGEEVEVTANERVSGKLQSLVLVVRVPDITAFASAGQPQIFVSSIEEMEESR